MTEQRKVGANSTVTLAYRILADEQELESASEAEPATLQLGQGEWPAQLELALIGELPGAELRVAVSAQEQVFGEVDPARVQTLAVDDFDCKPPGAGCLMAFELPGGEEIEGVVLKADASAVEVDFNHPYAGRDLQVEIKVLAIADK